MDEIDQDLRNIKLAQIGLQPVISNVLNDESFTKEQPFAFERICDEEQPSPITSTTKTSNAITTTTREQLNITSESSPATTTTQQTNKLSQYPNSRSASHNNNNNNNANREDSDTAKNKKVKLCSTGSLELQKLVINHCFSEHSQSSSYHSSSSNFDSSQSNNNKTNTETCESNYEKDKYTLNFGCDDDQQKSGIMNVSNQIRQEQQPQQTAPLTSATSSTFSAVSLPGAFLMRGSTVTGQAQKGMITPCHNNDTKSCDKTMPEEDEDFQQCAPSSSSVEISREEKKKKLFFMIGITLIISILIVIVVAVPTTVLTKNKPQGNSPTSFQHIADLLSECDDPNENNKDLSMIDPITAAKYQDLKQQFAPNKQVERCSPQHLALLSLSIQGNNMKPDEYSVSVSRYILSVFFFSLRGHKWHSNAGWISLPNECRWYKVECTKGGKVTGLNLVTNGLVGTVPNEIYQLTSLLHMELSNNDISGTISSNGVQNLSHLTHLGIRFTFISGPLPSEIFALTALSTLSLPLTSPPTVISESSLALLSNLRSLSIPGDVLGDSIPTEIGLLTSLTRLEIYGSTLEGQIPNELAQLSMLQILVIDAALLTGTIPDILFEKNKNWREIFFGSNPLRGTIPSLIGTQERLETLILLGNGLSGSIPTEIGNCSSLKTLNLSRNKLEGTIPTEIGSMNALESLVLNFNELTGTLPTEIAGLENLTSVSVDGCPQLSGILSPIFCQNQISVLLERFDCIDDSLSKSCREQSCCQES